MRIFASAGVIASPLASSYFGPDSFASIAVTGSRPVAVIASLKRPYVGECKSLWRSRDLSMSLTRPKSERTIPRLCACANRRDALYYACNHNKEGDHTASILITFDAGPRPRAQAQPRASLGDAAASAMVHATLTSKQIISSC
jgi:hypothetical protein